MRELALDLASFSNERFQSLASSSLNCAAIGVNEGSLSSQCGGLNGSSFRNSVSNRPSSLSVARKPNIATVNAATFATAPNTLFQLDDSMPLPFVNRPLKVCPKVPLMYILDCMYWHLLSVA